MPKDPDYPGPKSGVQTWASKNPQTEWQGTVKGATKHTYGVNGKNDPD